MIPFNKPAFTGNEEQHVIAAMRSSHISGDGQYGRLCQGWFEEKLKCKKALLTPSCTHALEMAALLIDVQPGDEIIMPSYTFVSTANAFVLRGAKIIFVDICPNTMNINAGLIEAAITQKTKAIVPVHYAGVACEVEAIMELAERYGLYVIEDAAQGMMSSYKGRLLGSIGHLAAYSFHETKNYTSGGEGGLLIINDERFMERAEIIREKGTNRSKFFRGMVDKYSWVDIGSSYLPSDIQAAYLWGQLEESEKIHNSRVDAWAEYYSKLKPLAEAGSIELPAIPNESEHNGHIFYIKVADIKERGLLFEFLKERGGLAVFHYVPLHTSVAGRKFGRFHGEDSYTTQESERLVRLPMWYGIEQEIIGKVASSIAKFYALRS